MRLILLVLALGLSAVSAYILPNNTVTARADTFANPVLWEDLADLDLVRVGDAFYYSASTMHYSPGAPILRSYDLVSWEYVGHSVPRLEFGSVDYDLPLSSHAYVRGIWASTLKHRASTGTFFWLGCVDFSNTYIYTSPAAEGPWTQSAVLDHCYYDAGMLVDDDDTIYVAYASGDIEVAQLSADGLSEVKSQVVYEGGSLYIEGSRFYKKDGFYYILVTAPPTDEYVLRSSSVFGPYELQPLAITLSSPTGGGSPHQGGLIDTPNGDWYYMGFSDSYPGGRIPVLAPITWSADGWPSMVLADGTWGATYPYPLTPHALSPSTGTDTFTFLPPTWEWNHNPDDSAWSIDDSEGGAGLVLRTASVTLDLYAARNTLTRRILGPQSSGTLLLDVGGMRDGDRAGLSMFRTTSAWVGVQQIGDGRQIVMVNGLTMGGPFTTPETWATTGTGSVVEGAALDGNQVYLRVTADIEPGGTNSASFSYSADGVQFFELGETLALDTTWEFYMGYRYGVFNYATLDLGGSVTVKSFEVQSV